MATVRLPKPLSTAELRILHDELHNRPDVAAACVMLEETGLRISEFMAITRDEAISWPRPPVWCRRPGCRRHRALVRIIGKGDRERIVPLTPRALRAARTLLAANGHKTAAQVVRKMAPATPDMSEDGNGALQGCGEISSVSLVPWSERGLRWLIAEAGKRGGVEAYPHRFRHTYCTQLVESGVPIEVVADMMGHTSVEITRLYFLLSERGKWEALRRRRRWLWRR